MDNFVNKSGDKRVENMLKENTATTWYQTWVDYLCQPPFYHGENQQEIKTIVEQLCLVQEQGDSCMRCEHCPQGVDEMTHSFIGQLPVHKPLVWDAPYLYLQRYWALEHQLAQRVSALVKQHVPQVDTAEFADLLTDSQQKQALAVGVNSAFAMITGGPGTGKTYILARIVAVLKKFYPEMRIAMAAPTGKAAQRMQEALQNAFSDQKLLQAGLYHPDFATQHTQTLHRLLGMGHRQIPRFHQHHPLPYDVVVVDEASMLDLTLANALFNAIQAPTRLILLGDANQLSSVDVGYVLADLHQVPQLQPYQIALKTSRRFSDDAQIGRFARFIYAEQNTTVQTWRESIQPQHIEKGQSFAIALAEQDSNHPLPKDWVGFYPLAKQLHQADIQSLYQTLAQGYADYIVALKQHRQGSIDKVQLAIVFDHYRILVVMRYFELGLDAINHAMTMYLKEKLHIVHEGEWFYGRPVMMQYNDYQLGLSNGDIGICLVDPNQPEQYSVYFPSLHKDIAAARLPQSIQTAFALTIHKSQGSEFRHTAVVLDQRAENLLSKELLYTAITRAKKMVSIYSSEMALVQSLCNQTQRQSGLAQQIQRGC
jgi:exodeoxyribonuclease V alpha subunit